MNLKNIAMFLSIGALIFASSCKKDDPTTSTTDASPTITSFTTTSTSANIGDKVTIGYIVAKGTADIKSVKLEQSFDAITVTSNVANFDTTISKGSAGYGTSNFYTLPSAGVYKSVNLKLTVTDANSKSASQTITITVKGSASSASFSGTIIAAQGSSTGGSFFSTSEQKVYTGELAKNSPTKIDFCYYYDAVTMASIAAPSDASVEKRYYLTNNLDRNPEKWSVRNVTTFKKSNVTYPQSQPSNGELKVRWDNNSNGISTKVTLLDVGNVFDFYTDGGKYGTFKVSDVKTGSTGQITISGFVQN